MIVNKTILISAQFVCHYAESVYECLAIGITVVGLKGEADEKGDFGTGGLFLIFKFRFRVKSTAAAGLLRKLLISGGRSTDFSVFDFLRCVHANRVYRR